MDFRKYWELGDLVNEFVDEYSVLYFSTQTALLKGVNIPAVIKNDKIQGQVINYPQPHFLGSIDRVNQLSYWLKPEFEVYSLASFSNIVKDLNLTKLHRSFLFEGDEVSFEFTQNGKTLWILSGVVSGSSSWFKNYSPNKKIISHLNKLNSNLPLNIVFKITKPSAARLMAQEQLLAISKDHDQFLKILLDKFNNKHQLRLNEQEIKSLPLHPKRLNVLYNCGMEKNLYLFLQEPTDYYGEVNELNLINFIKSKVNYWQINQMPFTKVVS